MLWLVRDQDLKISVFGDTHPTQGATSYFVERQGNRLVISVSKVVCKSVDDRLPLED